MLHTTRTPFTLPTHSISNFQSDPHHSTPHPLPTTKVRFKQVLDSHFPASRPMPDYVRRSLHLLSTLGFCKRNALACVSVCRDELTKPLVTSIQRTWDNVFSFSGLAGMLFMGRTGFRAAHHHAPYLAGKRRQIFFAFPHIGLGPRGEMGYCLRREDDSHSQACGALIALQQELGDNRPKAFDPLDPELSLMHQRFSHFKDHGKVPDLITLTQHTYGLIVQDLERMIAQNIDPDDTDYAVFTGIQIHGPAHKCYIWSGTSYAMVNGIRHDLSFRNIPLPMSYMHPHPPASSS